MHPETLVLFDGECTLCNGFVQFLLSHDVQRTFHFASLQSELGRQILGQYGISVETISTIVLIHQEKSYIQSNAILEIARLLGIPWRYLYFFRHLPLNLRDRLYQLVASHRYHWFGRQQECLIPTAELRQRLLS